MPYGMYISAAGAEAQSRRLEVISNNLANVDTPGFKRQLAVLEARHAEAITRGEDYAGSQSINDVGGGVSLRETLTDFSRGIVKPTGIPTDLAIDGEGFFLVEKDGKQLLTRAGNFRFSAAGRLQTQDGYAVLSDDGRPVRIDVGGPTPRLLPQGVLTQGDAGTVLALVKPQSLGDLAKAGENLFSPLADTVPVAADQRRVLEGHLETSTVKPTLEMMDLIEASRAYEANVRMIQNHDQMIGSLVNRVLRQS
jgi:flagellar basal-body rod protein FlgF